MAAAAALGPLLQALGVTGGGAAAGGAAAGGAAAAEGAASGMATEQLLNKLIDRIPRGGGDRGGGESRFGQLLSTGKTAVTGGSFGEKIGDLLKFGPLGLVVGNLTRRFKAAASIPGQFIEWGDALKEGKRHLIAFNGQIAVAMVESERRGIIRQVGEGRRVGASTAFLTEGLDDLKDAVQPLKDLFSNGLNLLIGIAARIATVATNVAKLHPVVAAVLAIQRWIAGKDEGEPAFVEFLKGVKEGGLGEFDREPKKQPKPKGMG